MEKKKKNQEKNNPFPAFLPVIMSLTENLQPGDDIFLVYWIDELSLNPRKAVLSGKITRLQDGLIYHNIEVKEGNSGNGIFRGDGLFIGVHIGQDDAKQPIAFPCLSIWNWLEGLNDAITMDIEIDREKMHFIIGKTTANPYHSQDLDFYIHPISKLATKLSIRGDRKHTIIVAPKEFKLSFPEHPNHSISRSEESWSCELPNQSIIVLRVFGKPNIPNC